MTAYDQAWLDAWEAKAAAWRGTGGARCQEMPGSREMRAFEAVAPLPQGEVGREIPSSPANPRDISLPAAAHLTAGHQGPAALHTKVKSASRAAGTEAVMPGKVGNKFKAKRTVGPGGRIYDSKAEARMAQRLEEERQAGGIVSWVPQVSLPCGVDENGRDVRYRADALVVLEVRPDGSFVGKLLDRKGMDTPNSRTKRAALRMQTGLDVQVMR